MRKTVKLTEQLKILLEQIQRNGKIPQRLAQRAQIVLDLHLGVSPTRVSELIGKARSSVYRWLDRWQEKVDELIKLEQANADDALLSKRLGEALSDAPRSGAPPTYTVEQVTQVIALACEDPRDSGRPISHWSIRELADEALKREIVSRVSVGAVGHVLREVDLKPHRFRYWLNAKPEDPEAFDKTVGELCGLYEEAPKVAKAGIHITSVDEKTGIQALERCHPDHPMRPGKPQLIEFEYARRGTQDLIASFDVATGKVLGSVTDTHAEADWLAHITRTVDTDPEARWIFISDQLHTHKSESIVHFVAQECRIDDNLGVKGRSGILKSRHTRAEFLSDPDHRIRFVYTPKHSSWLNQVEIWFSILVRKLLRRTSFVSVEQLRARILEFIEYFNKTMAKPFKWTYKGRVLQGA